MEQISSDTIKIMRILCRKNQKTIKSEKTNVTLKKSELEDYRLWLKTSTDVDSVEFIYEEVEEG